MKSKQTDAQFTASLAGRLQKPQNAAPLMHMNDLPAGKPKSLAALVHEHSSPESAGTGDLTVREPDAVPTAAIAPLGFRRQIPLHLIVDSPYQPRKRYDEGELQLLGQTFQNRGQDEPIKLRQLPNGKFELIAGHRRVRAARMIGWSEIDAWVVTMTDREACLATLVHNESNVKLSDFERALAYRLALEEGFAKNQSEVASIFGCTQGRVSQCLALLDLPTPIVDQMRRYPELISYRLARVIKDMLAQHPDDEATIVRAVEVLIDRPQMDQSELRAQLQKLFEKKRVRSKPPATRLIPDKNGESAFRVVVRDRDIVIQVDDGVDLDVAVERAMAAMREHASSIEIPKKQ